MALQVYPQIYSLWNKLEELWDQQMSQTQVTNGVLSLVLVFKGSIFLKN